MGAVNVDLVVQVPRVPVSDETVFGSELAVLPGGKGLNQAIAVARLGGRAALVGKVGDDAWGRLLYQTLADAGVETSHVTVAPGGATGAAIVLVGPEGDSTIVLARSATAAHDAADISRARPALETAAVCLVQLELPVEVLAPAIEATAGAGSRTVGTLAPVEPLPRGLMDRLDAIVLNTREAARMLHIDPHDVDKDPLTAARTLIDLGPASAIITLGPRGAAYTDARGAAVVPALPVEVIDATGAGDAFTGAFALAVARGAPLQGAVTSGIHAAVHAVQTPGAQLH